MSDAFVREDGLPTIGLAIIAKDEAETLPRLLDSVGFTEDGFQPGEDHTQPNAAVDFIVVADTGSTDETKAIAKARGCFIIDVPWTDDFSAARQASYDALPEWCQFTLWADCDDVIEGAEKLRQLAAMMPAEAVGTLHKYDYARDDAGNCFTADTEIFGGSGVVATTARRYVGELIKLRFASGRDELSVTPNHPILTPQGWLRAGSLDVGDRILGGRWEDLEGAFGPDSPDQHQAPTLIGDIAQTFEGEVLHAPTTPDDFHGDGKGSKVKVVRTDRLLAGKRHAERSQMLSQGVLEMRRAEDALLARLSPGAADGEGVTLSTPSSVSSSDGGPIVVSPERRGLRNATAMNASTVKTEIDRATCDPEALRQAVDAFAGQIEVDEVVGVERIAEWSGHVYNLETIGNWYAANGVIVHNCICELWRERLVRNVPGCVWMLPIHEVLQVPGALVHVPDVVWHHHQPPDRVRDPERNYKILRKSYEDSTANGEPADLRTIAYLGTEALGLGRPEEAAELLKQHLARQDAVNSEERCQVAHKLSIALRAVREGEKDVPPSRMEESMEAGHLAIHERPDWPDGYIDLAELSLRREEPERALRFCELAIERPTPKTLLIINPLEYQYQPLLMKSVALAKLGQIEEAWTATQEALAITPYREDLQAQANLVGEQLKRKETVEAFLKLREILIRHDENGKAQTLMECAPYYVWTDPAVWQARLDTREMTLHATEPEVYGSYYRENPNEAPFEHTGIPIEEAHERFHRVKFLRDGLDKQAEALRLDRVDPSDGFNHKAALRILDLSMNDGWMLANLAAGGYGTNGNLSGMDLNRGAVERAEGRLEDVEADGDVVCTDLHGAPEHFDPASFDAVVLFETLEHVPDPAATIDAMCQMVKPGGQIYISTPQGAYEGGNVPEWAKVESKGHLRAMTPGEVAGLLLERGKITDMASEQRLIVASAEPATNNDGGLKPKVVFYAGPVDAQPEQIVTKGLGGSETALCKMAEHFARRGYDVRVYAGPGGGLRHDHVTVDGTHDVGEVLYEPMTAWDPGEACDLFVSCRVPEAFDRTINAPQRLLWLHDADYGDRLTPERVDRATSVAVLSEFHRDLMVEKYPFIEDKLFLTRNGIETSLYQHEELRRKPWLVYSSSPDRGLDVVLEMWPVIRQRAEEAGVDSPELHSTYSPIYREFRESGQFPHLAAFHRRIEELREAAGDGLVDHDSMSQPELAELFRRSMVWAYPSWNTPAGAAFPEISCIGAMEAQAGGCIPVALDYGALKETARAGFLIKPDARKGKLTLDWREKFIEGCVGLLSNEDWRSDTRPPCQDWALGQDWSGVCDQWEAEILTDGKVPA